jgi:hypothetical protein
MELKIKKTVVDGKEKIILKRVTTGEEHVRGTALTVMKGYEFMDNKKD